MAYRFTIIRPLSFVNVFLLFHYYFSLKKAVAPSFEQTRIPFPKGCILLSFGIYLWYPLWKERGIPLTQRYVALSLVEISSLVPEKTIFEFRPYIFAIFFMNISMEMGLVICLNKFNSPSSIGIGAVVLEKNIEMWSLRRRRQILTRKKNVERRSYSFWKGVIMLFQ